ncbi:MAG: PglZ domain-containing protein, partial [Desulfobacterales bacterium]|nr:PglZ domain-containing protein [Desulfobacterales bacterium]
MGAVKEYLIGMIRRDLKAKGLCVWLDARGEYAEFVPGLKARGKRGEFEHPVLTFDGSFLEMMIALGPCFSSKDNQPCLVYAPGLTQAAIRGTPLLEAYKAGKELQYNLKNLVRSACAGKLAPAQLQHLLEEENFSLELADKRVTEEDRTHPGLKPVISRYSVTDIAIDLITARGRISREMALKPEERFEALRDYLNLQFGLSEAWLRDWRDPAVEDGRGMAAFRFPLAAHILCVEYVWDLRRDPVDQRMPALKEISGNQHGNCRAAAEELRLRHPDAYREIALEVEPGLNQEFDQNPEYFGSIDTFQFEEGRLLDLAFTRLENRAWPLVSSLVEERIGAREKSARWSSFWARCNESHRWAWQWLRMAAGLRRRLEEAMKDIRARSPETCAPDKLLELYTAKNGWHRVDRLHREFEQWTARLKMLTGVSHYRQTTTQIKKCREAYREFVNDLATLFNRSCGLHGFLPPEDLRQRGFHKRAAAPHLAQGPAAIFYLDAFRYELGAVLAERLAEDKGEVKLSAVFAELPTVTAVGMNALL